MTELSCSDRALVEEATKKSGLIWVRGTDGPARALWHVWHEGAACLVGDGPGEQPLPAGLTDGGAAEVTVRSKDKGGRLVAWTARVVELAPGLRGVGGGGRRAEGQAAERAGRASAMTERWARECRVLRLEPTGESAARQLPDGLARRAAAADPRDHRRPIRPRCRGCCCGGEALKPGAGLMPARGDCRPQAERPRGRRAGDRRSDPGSATSGSCLRRSPRSRPCAGAFEARSPCPSPRA